MDTGRAIIGAHLQTWTCPPIEEDVSPFNSFQCNLPAALEREKLLRLIARIEETFALRPTIHKAGRYGFSPRAVGMLQALGFRYDLSIGARYDASHEGGPDFRRHSAAPFWLDEEGGMLALPTTAGFSGMAAAAGPWLHPLISNPVMKRVRAEAAFSRLGVLERVRLSPEGHTLGELKRVTRALLRQGVRVLTFSFHSPSVMPGCTPYVSTDDDLVCFLRTCRDYLAFFRDEIGGTFSTPDGVRAALKD